MEEVEATLNLRGVGRMYVWMRLCVIVHDNNLRVLGAVSPAALCAGRRASERVRERVCVAAPAPSCFSASRL